MPAQSCLDGGGGPRSSGTTTWLSPMRCRLHRRCLQRRCRPNHRVCRHILRLIARFADWALGISSPPNLPWSAPQVRHPPKTRTGCPWMGTTGRRRRHLQHRLKTRPHLVSGIWSLSIGIGTIGRRRVSHTLRADEGLPERAPPFAQGV